MENPRSLLLGLTLLLPAFAAAQPALADAAVNNAAGSGVKNEPSVNKSDGKINNKGKRAAPAKKKRAPEWVIKGGSAFKDNGKLAWYGVGSAPRTISDLYLRRETADNRARADISNGFGTTTESTATITHTADGGERTERSVTTFKSGDIAKAQITERYQAPDGTIYSLAKIAIKQLKPAGPASGN